MGMNSKGRREQVTKGNKQHVRRLGNFLVLLLLAMSISSVDSGPLHVKPEVDLNLATEANRILYVLNKIIERVYLAGVLPVLLKNNGLLLENILDPAIVSQIVQNCRKYYHSKEGVLESSTDFLATSSHSLDKLAGHDAGSSGSNFSSRSKSSSDRNSEDQSMGVFSTSTTSIVGTKSRRKDDDVCEVIYTLEENPEVLRLAQSLRHKLTPEMKFFIKALIEFKDRMEQRLRENATQYKTREKYMRETYEKNERAKKAIRGLEEELLVTKTDANVCLIARHILIKRHQNKINKIKQNSHEAIEKRVHESEKTMVNNWKISSAKQDDLQNELQQTSEKYSNLLRDDLATEKTLRSKRAKVENQVLGWIQKFDQDIGEKQAEEEEIQARLDKETEAVNNIQSKLDEQEEEYDELMQEKGEYEEEMLQRRLNQFMMIRSARRIQRSFRLYKARKLARKLAKKNKKGKKKGEGKKK